MKTMKFVVLLSGIIVLTLSLHGAKSCDPLWASHKKSGSQLYSQIRDSNNMCLQCHSKDIRGKSIFSSGKRMTPVDETRFNISVHKDLTCLDCHTGMSKTPHKPPFTTISCSQCHSAAEKLKGEKTPYNESVHSKTDPGNHNDFAMCISCHGTHDIMPAESELSKVSRKNVPKTCGECHEEIYEVYIRSSHGRGWSSGDTHTAICIDCHGAHDIKSTKDGESKVSAMKIVDTCSRCHNDSKMMTEYGLSASQTETFNKSYHGIAYKLGDFTVANCANCHGYHNILPSSDPDSMIHPEKLHVTCGKCHRHVTKNVAKGKTHVSTGENENPILYLESKFFFIVITASFFGFICHISLDLYSKIRKRRSKRSNESKGYFGM